MVEKMNNLYRRASTGAIWQWRMEFNEQGNAYRTVSGRVDGKLVESEWTYAEPKNVGKANETTSEQQAKNEVSAKYKKQLKSGYFYSGEDVDNFTSIKPMLAKSYDKYDPFKHFANGGGIWVQPKLDGIRGILHKGKLYTRNGEQINTCDHIIRALQPMIDKYPDMVFDGELYSHDLKDNFNKICSLIKRDNPTQEELEEVSSTIQYWVYDFISPETFCGRRSYYHDIHDLNLDLDYPPVVCVPTQEVHSKEEADEIYGKYIEEGYEGMMYRNGDSYYQNKRTKDLLKRKEYQDDEFRITGINEGIGNRQGMVGNVDLVTKDGIEFSANIMGTREYLRDIFERRDSMIDKEATVQYIGLTPGGKPRFGCVKVIHETKRVVVDENDDDLDPDSILVIRPYDDDFGNAEKTSTLLVNARLRKDYEKLNAGIEEAKNLLLATMKEQSGSKKDLAAEISSTFTRTSGQFLVAILRIAGEVESQTEAPFAEIPYDIVFDPKVVEMLQQEQVREALADYIRRFNELIDQSTYFKRGTFTYYNAAVIAKALADNGFFDAAHSVRLNADEAVEIKTKSQLEELINNEKESVTSDKKLRKKFENIEKLLHKNVSVREFNNFIAENEDILSVLDNLENFKEQVWKSYFVKHRDVFDRMVKEIHDADERRM